MSDLFLIDDEGEDAIFESNGEGGILAKLPYGGKSCVIREGDYVLVRSEPPEPPLVAMVANIYAARKQKKCTQMNSNMRFAAKWFHRFEDLRSSLSTTVIAGRMEVFETDLVEGGQSADAILGKCNISSYADFLSGREKDEANRDLYFYCRFHYDQTTVQITASSFDFTIRKARGTDSDKEFEYDVGSDEEEDEEDVSSDSDVAGKVRGEGTRKRRRRAKYQFSLPTVRERPMLGREEQTKQIKEFVETAVEETHSGSRSLYISGVPGTGKTATVMSVLASILDRSKKGEIGPIKVAEVNGMAMPDAAATYSVLYEAVSGRRGISPMTAASLLDRSFSRGRKGKPLILLVLDEMDTLMSRRQKVLYDLFEWATKQNSKLAIIGIANTMDLPERVLPRITSRIGLNRLIFPPYTAEQVSLILRETLLPSLYSDEEAQRFTEHSLDLCARKVAAVSGDLRRAVNICRSAARIAKGATVTPIDIAEAAAELSASKVGSVVSNLSEHEKAVLRSVANIVKTSSSEVHIPNLLTQVNSNHGLENSFSRSATLRLLAMSLLSRLDRDTITLNITLEEALS